MSKVIRFTFRILFDWLFWSNPYTVNVYGYFLFYYSFDYDENEATTLLKLYSPSSNIFIGDLYFWVIKYNSNGSLNTIIKFSWIKLPPTTLFKSNRQL